MVAAGMGKRVLITGATGLIGAQALRLLVEQGWEVDALTSRPHHESRVDVPITWHVVDLTDAASVERVLPTIGASHLLHFAWSVTPGQVWTSLENLRWVEASLRLVRIFAAAGGVRAVVAGSCGEYSWANLPCSEHTTPIAPRTLYGASKVALLNVLTAAAAELQLSLGWGRTFFVYGPNEHPDRLVASVVRNLLANEPAITTHGRQIRDYLHSVDVAGAFVELLGSNVQGPVNVGSGEGHALADIVRCLGEITGRSELIRLGGRAAAEYEPPSIVADISRLSSEVGFRPMFDLTAGLADTVAWWRAHGRVHRGIPR